MLTLYGTKGSGAAIAEMALDACGLGYRQVRASRWEPDSAFEELLRINPLGQIPTLVLDDGTVLSESVAILLHLALAHPHSGLLPSDASQRASAMRGLVFIAANCYAAISVIDYPERWCEDIDDALRKRIVSAARRQLHTSWDVFADQFTARPFFNGEQPGALDFAAVVVSRWSGTRAHAAASRPEFAAALQRIEAHPRVAAVIARHWGT